MKSKIYLLITAHIQRFVPGWALARADLSRLFFSPFIALLQVSCCHTLIKNNTFLKVELAALRNMSKEIDFEESFPDILNRSRIQLLFYYKEDKFFRYHDFCSRAPKCYRAGCPNGNCEGHCYLTSSTAPGIEYHCTPSSGDPMNNGGIIATRKDYCYVRIFWNLHVMQELFYREST